MEELFKILTPTLERLGKLKGIDLALEDVLLGVGFQVLNNDITFDTAKEILKGAMEAHEEENGNSEFRKRVNEVYLPKLKLVCDKIGQLYI